MRRRIVFMAVLAGFVLASPAVRAEPPDGLVSFSGTVARNELEAGFWTLVADAGPTYVPINLPAENQVAGHRVRVTGRIRSDMAGVQMRGPLIEIVDIAVLPATAPVPPTEE